MKTPAEAIAVSAIIVASVGLDVAVISIISRPLLPAIRSRRDQLVAAIRTLRPLVRSCEQLRVSRVAAPGQYVWQAHLLVCYQPPGQPDDAIPDILSVATTHSPLTAVMRVYRNAWTRLQRHYLQARKDNRHAHTI